MKLPFKVCQLDMEHAVSTALQNNVLALLNDNSIEYIRIFKQFAW